MCVLVLDNYDSFTYNLVQYLGELDVEPVVRRNDAMTVDDVRAMRPAAVVISPGPGVPQRAGITVPLIRALSGRAPMLGVCLGHQAIAVAFGGRVVRANRLMHGKTSAVRHDGDGLFQGLPNPLRAMRYHSLVVDPRRLPAVLAATAWTDDMPSEPVVMGLRHREHPTYGVQFHPESVGTEDGRRIIANFLTLAGIAR